MNPDGVVFTDEAAADLEDLAEYLDARNPAAAVRTRDEILAAVRMLAAPMPRVEGPAVTLRSGVVCRRHFVYPVVLYYRRDAGGLTIVRAYHHAREPIAR